MTACRYNSSLLVLKIIFSTHEEKLRIPARSCNFLDFLKSILILKILKPL